jgi:hypothetical protein
MKFVAFLMLSCVAAGSLPAAATTDKEVIRQAIHEAVATKPAEPPSRPEQRDDAKARDIAREVVSNDTPASTHRDREYNAESCTTLVDCPFGSLPALTFEEVRHIYRNYPDSELWNICLGRRAAPYPGGSKDACMMLGSPDPLRPVDVPHGLERDENAVVDTKLESDGPKSCKPPAKECVREPGSPPD